MPKRPADEPAGAEKSLDLTAFRQVPDTTGLSLDSLSAALEGKLNTGDDPYREAAPPASGQPEAEVLVVEPPEAVAEVELSPRSILEAMLFVGSPQGEPLSSQQVASLMRGVRAAEIDLLVRELNAAYAARNCPYTIVAEGAGYRLTLRDEFAPLRDKFFGRTRQARLSKASIEVLAAVAYNGPITADEISRLRGTPSGAVLAQLVRRQLLRLERTATKPRKIHYSTTPRFLQLFGLESLEDLPRDQQAEPT